MSSSDKDYQSSSGPSQSGVPETSTPDPTPDPTLDPTPDPTPDPRAPKKGDVDSVTSDEDSRQRQRKQSMVGMPGYVSQILEELDDDTVEIVSNQEPAKPIRHQTMEERRASVKATEDDLKQYFTEIAKDAKTTADKLKKSTSVVKLSPYSSKEELHPKATQSESRPSGSEWKPCDVPKEHVGFKTERSWVGTYIVGKDYWSPEEKLYEEVESPTIKCCIDDEKKRWYDMPLKKSSTKDSSFFTQKTKTLGKMEALKVEMTESYQEMMQQSPKCAHPKRGAKEQNEFTGEFMRCFQEVARSGEFSHGDTHISMVDADKWLEKIEILDHKHLTLIHTGLCFTASGGSRHRGLSFLEFTHYLQMISHITGMRLKELLGMLQASQRKDVDFKTKD